MLYAVGGAPWTGISPSQGLYLHIEHKHRINAHTDIHALSEIRTHDHSVPVSEDGSCLRWRGNCDRHITYYTTKEPAVTWKDAVNCFTSDKFYERTQRLYEHV
jgi:hypothetical protein